MRSCKDVGFTLFKVSFCSQLPMKIGMPWLNILFVCRSLVDVFRLESIVTSLDYSPNGEFIATSLHNNNGILLWMNKTIFAHISLMPIPADYEPPLVNLPKVKLGKLEK